MNEMTHVGAARPQSFSLGLAGHQWEHLLDTLPIGIYSCDAAGRVLKFNEQAAQLWGRSPNTGPEGDLYCGAYKSYGSDGAPLPLARTPTAEVLRTGQPVRGREMIFERPDGSRIFIQASAEPLLDEAGQLVGAVNCLQDISARKQAENRQAQDQLLLRAIFDATPECIKIVAEDGSLLQMNPAGQAMIEADENQKLEGACVYDLIAPEFLDIWQANHQRVCRGERLTWEFDIIGLGGTRRHMETHAVPLQMPDGHLAQLAITRDITHRKQQSRKFRDREHTFRELLQALPTAIYTTDKEGRITFFNEAAVDFAGRRPELGERWCVTWRLYNPDGTPLPLDECPMAVALHEERPIRDQEAIAERPDGARRWFIPYPTPLRDSSGAMVGAINMLVDITHRKEAERQQKLLIDELNHRVKNTLATVQSLMMQSAQNAQTIDEYRQTVEARLLAMSRAHDQLSRRNWGDAELRELTKAALAPYLSKGNIVFSGDEVVVPPRAALMLSMIIHELATNAAKYGALSQAGGKVELTWGKRTKGSGEMLQIAWAETGGPKVESSRHRGFGSRLLERGVQAELRGKATIDFAPSGLRCGIEMPL